VSGDLCKGKRKEGNVWRKGEKRLSALMKRVLKDATRGVQNACADSHAQGMKEVLA